MEFPLLFEGDHRGAVLQLDVSIQVKEEGTYWFEVLMSDVLMTKMPPGDTAYRHNCG